MKSAHQVIKRPLQTEKVVANVAAKNIVAFEVDANANKIEIKKAVEEIWNVHVEQVRTMVVRGKVKNFGARTGKRKNWKKAYISLKEGDKIDLFQGA